MKSVKLTVVFLLSTIILFLTSCFAPEQRNDNQKISVVCTMFPQYDWVREIVGDNADIFDIVCLSDNGVDMHSYQPTVDDIVEISECDILISAGGNAEKWIRDALETTHNKSIRHIELIELLGDGIIFMDGTDGCECDSENNNHVHSFQADEHVWLSLRNAVKFCEEIAVAIGECDPENAEYYTENSKEYIEKLYELDSSTAKSVSSAPRDTLIIADRFPFRYAVRDYGINYYAAFEGCTADSEVSFETVAFLSQKADELNVKVIFVSDGSDRELAQAVSRNTTSNSHRIIELNSMQSVSQKDIKNGMTYLSVMQNNFALIQSALSV